MRIRRKRRDLTWKQALFLLIYGAALSRLSFANLDIWGSGHDPQHQVLYELGFFGGAIAFLAGILGFIMILVKGVSPTSPVAAPPRPSTQPPVVTQAAAANVGGATLMILRVVLIAAVAVACFEVVRDVEHKSIWGGSYFRSYCLGALLFLIMSQLPYAFALFRTWTGLDRTGLAIAIAAGIVEAMIHLPFFYSSNAPLLENSPLLLVLGVATAILAYPVYRSAGSREGDVRCVASSFAALLAYTLLWRVIYASLLLPY